MRPLFFLVVTFFLSICAFFVLIFGLFVVKGVVSSLNSHNTYCFRAHNTVSPAPSSLVTAQDYFDLGNYDYDRGDCQMAIVDYTKAIALNPQFAQAYNNRAYTYMTEENYALALPDLDKAIALRPNYIHALMNRADIHNFYYQIDRKAAISDYDRIIAQGALLMRDNSVCGHRMVAIDGGVSFRRLFYAITHSSQLRSAGCN